MTSCGCFECICGLMPEANGVIGVNREYGGMTPTGMTFGELASMTGGGVQTPGFMGHGRHFIGSKKFISAEGGLIRWSGCQRSLRTTWPRESTKPPWSFTASKTLLL
jgi:acetyl-CoA synthase